MSISTIIIAKNEAENLKISLPKLHWCKDIVLVDDNSTDETIKIAEQFGCRVFTRIFDGFGTQKQFAVSQALNNWVLNIDADEVLTDELIEEIQILKLNNEISGYELPIRHVFLDKIFKYGKESRYYHLRLFNKLEGNFDSASVHEKVILKGNVLKLQNVILHNSYKNLDHYFEKFNRYTSIGAEKLKEKGKSRNLLMSIVSFPIYFFKHYILYRNFLNGKAGFIWSYLNAWYHVVKYLKLNELNNK
ncbi:MAG: glycosyltransferase family 2 protein [Bacteroidetes bacterium]|nr:glycosyltransferase family 2 protein [Bacteroidota bacterium]